MIESQPGPTGGSQDLAPSAEEIAAFMSRLSGPSPAASDAERIDRITAMERLKQSLAGAQAVEAVTFKASQLAAQQAAGVRRLDLGKGISAQVALCRRESPHRAACLMGLAEALVFEMPRTMAALTAGHISEWRAILITRETACLSVEHRMEVDRVLGDRLASMSDREAVKASQREAYRLDPKGFLSRGKRAAADRHVSLRPAPDTMARFSALLPVAQGVALMAALTASAEAAAASGDERSRGQVMADTLVERVTGQSSASDVPVEVQLVMTDAALLGLEDTPAVLAGGRPLPAPLARDWIRGLSGTTQAWIRRLVTDPVDGRLAALDSRRRVFRDTVRRAVIIRDQWCRTPWCGAPIRHLDHVERSTDGGQTTAANGQGLCVTCNHAKEGYGWRVTPDRDEGAGTSVVTTTPTGHRYESRPPPLLLGSLPPRVSPGWHLDLVWAGHDYAA